MIQSAAELVTAFAITTGEPSTDKCIELVRAQTVVPLIEIIRDVTPMWRAFQEMIERCRTPYYVQVDADMLLDSDAIERLLSVMQINARASIAVGWLWGDAERRPIQGVKMYRHAVSSLYPYTDSLSCEMPQVRSMERDGHPVVVTRMPSVREGCMGLHYAEQNPEMAFRRAKRTTQKLRAIGHMGWFAAHARSHENRAAEEPTEIHKAALAGVVAGLVGAPAADTEVDALDVPHDYRRWAMMHGSYATGPTELTLYVTDRCNLRCNFCLRELGGTAESGEMSMAMASLALERFPTLKSVCIAGFGEPLLHPALPGIIDMCLERQKFVGLITNGVLLEEHAEWLQHRDLGYISVSMIASSSVEHKTITQTQTFDRVVSGLRKMAASRVRTGISYVCTRQNVDRLPDVIALAKDCGAKFINLTNLLPHAGVSHINFLSSVITTESAEALSLVAKAKTAPGADIVALWPTPIDLSKNPLRCISPFVSVGIDARGYVTPCRRVYPPSRAFGHVDHPNVWHSVAILNFRLAMTGDRPQPESCTACFANWQRQG